MISVDIVYEPVTNWNDTDQLEFTISHEIFNVSLAVEIMHFAE